MMEFFHHRDSDIFIGMLNRGKRRGGEPGVILNWLALMGWGAQHDHSDHSDGSSSSLKVALSRTTLMALQEIIQEVGRCIPLPSASTLPIRTV